MWSLVFTVIINVVTVFTVIINVVTGIINYFRYSYTPITPSHRERITESYYAKRDSQPKILQSFPTRIKLWDVPDIPSIPKLQYAGQK